MAYSESLASRVRHAVASLSGATEKRMFGGVGFLLHGHLLVGVWQDRLVARVGADAYDTLVARPHVGPFDPTGRPMTGWLLVAPDGVESDRALAEWLDHAVRFVRTLPPKAPGAARKSRSRRRNRSA